LFDLKGFAGFVAVLFLGLFIGTLAFSWRSDRFGPALDLMFTAVPVVAFLAWQLVPRTILGLDGWRWVGGDRRERLGAADKIAAAPACQGMCIGSRYDFLLGSFFAMKRKRFVNADRLVAALDADAVQLAPGKSARRAFKRAFGGHDRGAEIFIGAFEPRRHVHGVAHNRIVETLVRTDIADQRLVGIKPDALMQGKALPFGRLAVELVQTVAAAQRGVDRIAGVFWIVEWRGEHGDDRVADIFVDEAALLLMMSVIAERYSFMKRTSSGGASASEIDENPARSEKKIVTLRISPPSAGGVLALTIFSITLGAR